MNPNFTKGDKMINKVTLSCVLCSVFCVLSLSGCGSQLAAGGAGLFAGFTGSKTLDGIEADLERQEQALIDKYNRMVEAGVHADTLAEVRSDIEKVVLLRQGTTVVKSTLSTNWSDPKAAGGAIGTIAALAYAFVKRKDLKNTVAGVKMFRAKADESVKHELDQIMQDKKAAV